MLCLALEAAKVPAVGRIWAARFSCGGLYVVALRTFMVETGGVGARSLGAARNPAGERSHFPGCSTVRLSIEHGLERSLLPLARNGSYWSGAPNPGCNSPAPRGIQYRGRRSLAPVPYAVTHDDNSPCHGPGGLRKRFASARCATGGACAKPRARPARVAGTSNRQPEKR